MVGERWLEGGQVQRSAEKSRRVLDSPAAKTSRIYLRNVDHYAQERPVVLERGYRNLGRVLHPGIHMWGSIAVIKGGPGL